MNPFDLYGPQFLVFYAALTIVTMIVVAVLRRRVELAAGHGHAPTNDPYLIAYLRGGKNEVIRTAIISLVDRGLIDVRGDKLHTSAVGAQTSARKPVEQTLLKRCTHRQWRYDLSRLAESACETASAGYASIWWTAGFISAQRPDARDSR